MYEISNSILFEKNYWLLNVTGNTSNADSSVKAAVVVYGDESLSSDPQLLHYRQGYIVCGAEPECLLC